MPDTTTSVVTDEAVAAALGQLRPLGVVGGSIAFAYNHDIEARVRAAIEAALPHLRTAGYISVCRDGGDVTAIDGSAWTELDAAAAEAVELNAEAALHETGERYTVGVVIEIGGQP